MTTEMQALQQTVEYILRNTDPSKWSLQGLGMLRLYLSERVRLHIWDDRYIVPGVSSVHDHPWAFTSTIVAGELRQRRWTRVDENGVPHQRRLIRCNRGHAFFEQKLRCGVGCELVGEPAPVLLQEEPLEVYRAGQTYAQHADEIHQSMPTRGTITLITRVFGPNPDCANVFWADGEEWTSAEPRQATPEEVASIVGNALEVLRAEEPE